MATVFFFNVCGYCGFWGRKTFVFSVQPKTVSTRAYGFEGEIEICKEELQKPTARLAKRDRKNFVFSVQPKTVSTTLAAAAAKNNNRNQNDDPAIVVAEERIKAAHCNASLHYLKIMKRWEDV